MADIRVKDLTEASVPGADYYLLTDSATDGVKKVKTTNVIAKADIGLGNVDNTSDLNKPISTATQTALNLKADEADLISHESDTANPHAVTKLQVGLGNVDNTSDATKNAAVVTLTNKTISGANNTLTVREADLSTSDVTTGNVSTTKHGFAPKLPNDATKYLDGTGIYSVPAGGGGSLSADETTYWKDQAALLDPAAYVYWAGANWSVTVPAGETWYVVNAWMTTLNASSTWFQRKLSLVDAFPLNAGTVIAANGTAGAFLYVCRPALVTGNTEYASDPKGLYYARLAALRGKTLSSVSATITAGTAANTNVTTAFPTDFEDAIAAHVSVNDAAWCALVNAIGGGGLNTVDEISDVHQNRVTGKLLVPFSRSKFPSIRTTSANVSGNGTDTSLAGQAVLGYYKLPSNWRTTPLRAYRSAVLADSPVIYYPFDESSGTTVNDLGSAALNATYGGTCALGASGVTGDGDPSIQLTDSTARVAIPNSTNFDFGSGDFTLETWVWFNTLPAPSAVYNPTVVNAWQTAAVSNQAFMLAVYNGKLALLVGHTDATMTSVNSTISVSTGTFYHVIAGRQGGSLFIRVVGKETRQTTAVTKALKSRSTDPVWLGNTYNGTTYQNRVDGRVDEFALYNAALSDVRADAHHAAALGWA